MGLGETGVAQADCEGLAVGDVALLEVRDGVVVCDGGAALRKQSVPMQQMQNPACGFAIRRKERREIFVWALGYLRGLREMLEKQLPVFAAEAQDVVWRGCRRRRCGRRLSRIGS